MIYLDISKKNVVKYLKNAVKEDMRYKIKIVLPFCMYRKHILRNLNFIIHFADLICILDSPGFNEIGWVFIFLKYKINRIQTISC